MKSTVFNFRSYCEYEEAMQELGLSTHANQLEKRKKKYPFHFFKSRNKVYISTEYLYALAAYMKAIQGLDSLKHRYHDGIGTEHLIDEKGGEL
jgi:signal recognition particle subunit SEC65